MAKNITKIQVIILAAGHGKRMNNVDLPKVLVPLNGKPMITHLLKSVSIANICEQIVIVVGQKAELVKKVLGDSYIYVTQTEQNGTGHAVAATKDLLFNKAENIMVLYGDHPLLTSETIKNLANTHLNSGKVLTMATVSVPDFLDWRAGYADFGRILRNDQGKIEAIIEKKDATPEQLTITEVNPSFFCFQANWLWNNLDKLTNLNQQHEYYLTDLIGIAFNEGIEPITVAVNAREALGVNTPENLTILDESTKIVFTQ